MEERRLVGEVLPLTCAVQLSTPLGDHCLLFASRREHALSCADEVRAQKDDAIDSDSTQQIYFGARGPKNPTLGMPGTALTSGAAAGVRGAAFAPAGFCAVYKARSAAVELLKRRERSKNVLRHLHLLLVSLGTGDVRRASQFVNVSKR